MERLYAALRAAQGKRAVVYSVMAVAMIFLAALAAMGERWNLPILVSWVTASVLAVALIWFLCRSAWALRRTVAKLLKNQPFADSFLQTTEPFQPVFANREYRMELFVSETWLVLISANCSVIRPRAAFCGAERVLLENEYEHAVRLLFTDGDVTCRCEHVCDELLAILNTI